MLILTVLHSYSKHKGEAKHEQQAAQVNQPEYVNR